MAWEEQENKRGKETLFMPVLKREKRRQYVFITEKLFFFPTCVFVYHPPPLPQRFLFRQTAVCVVSKRHKERRVCISCFSGRGLLQSIHIAAHWIASVNIWCSFPPLSFFLANSPPSFPQKRERQKKLSISPPLPSFSLSLSFLPLFACFSCHRICTHKPCFFFGRGWGWGTKTPLFPFPLFLGCAKWHYNAEKKEEECNHRRKVRRQSRVNIFPGNNKLGSSDPSTVSSRKRGDTATCQKKAK